jgi:light-regulated signal transduction histidine kinase (bacteriophytochrome)
VQPHAAGNADDVTSEGRQSTPQRDAPDTDLLPVGTPINLDNCAREPIHVPGSIQPRGVLAVVREPDLVVTQVSANVGDLLGRPIDIVLDAHLATLIGDEPAGHVARAAANFGDLRQRNPLELVIDVDGEPRMFDAILHRAPGGVLLVELEIAYGERPFSFPNTYQAVRDSVEELNRAESLAELYDTAARAVRDLTGFDRVMVYRYDADYNGEVVAECKRDDLNSFLGLHYPASDIPAQARALYEKNWLRLISDVDYTPAPLVPAVDPATGAPLDLTHATLRSVSPIHIEYLKNMGVHASMSISLLRHGRLWGLIACHHYAGPHLPPYGARAAAEFLGSTLSLRLVDQVDGDELRARLDMQEILAKLAAVALDDDAVLAERLLGAPGLLDLVPADGVVVHLQGEQRTSGSVPPTAVVTALAAWARHTGEEIVQSDCLSTDVPAPELDPQHAAGVLALNLPDGQYVLWLRREVLRSVDWGGDPHNKAIAVGEGDDLRLSPRKSFERWREVVRNCSEPWTPLQTESAASLRRLLLESLYRRTRESLRVAETLQRSLLPERIPTLDGWQLSAHYEPAAGGRVGGDWYDAFELRDGRLVVLLGDIAGHGIPAAGAMAQVRNVLRAHLFDGAAPDEAFSALNAFCLHLVTRAFATVIAARVDLRTGDVEAASAGHLMPYLTNPVRQASIRLSPPIGGRSTSYVASRFVIEPRQGMVMYSDGLVEHRGESIDDGLRRLGETLSGAVDLTAARIAAAMTDRDVDDDVTIVTLRRL